MKICGVIAEYNPFHEGHAYQLKKAKGLSGADAVIVVMSGHFVQRGEPAITDPYVRAEAALKGGADAVFMMPPKASTASAEGFAAYGIATLDALGCDYISCGIEPSIHSDHSSQDIERLKEAAKRLADEDEAMGDMIRSALKGGLSYPAALAGAAGTDRLGPNAILAIEYLKAMRRLGSSMEFVPVERVGSGYHDEEIADDRYPSATALRKKILSVTDGSGQSVTFPVGPDDVMPMVIESIRNHMDELESFADCSRQIAQRIRNSRLHYNTFEEMVTDIKTRDVTYTRVARALMHILLGIRQDDVPKSGGTEGAISKTVSNAQLIGFSNMAVLTELSQRSAQKMGEGFTIISKAADYKDTLAGSAYAAEIYNQILWNKYHVEGKDFFRQRILKI